MSKQIIDPIQLRHGAKLTNRLVLSPMYTFSGLEGGFVSDDTLRYYGARSQAASLLITEFHYVSPSGGPCYQTGYPVQLGIYSDDHIEGERKLAAALQKDGNKAILQLHHGGIAASGRALKGEEVLAPSALDFSFLPYPVRELTDEEILEIIKDFGRAVKRAVQAGFSGVEIHGANHYLLQQFFSSTSNVRQDRWGGTLEKHMAFPLAVVKEVKRAAAKYAPEDFIIGYRISPDEIHEGQVGYTYEEAKLLVKELVKHELDYIHLSLLTGYASKPAGSDKTYAAHFKEVMDEQTKLITIGGDFSQEDAEAAIENTAADLVAIGRGTLIDPLFGYKIQTGQGAEIVHEISPEQLKNSQLTPGLLEVFSRKDSGGLPPLPGHDSITHLHTGKYGDEGQ